MKQLLTWALICFGISTAFAQKATLSGLVKDAATGEELIGATVFIEQLKQGTATNSYGFYSLSVPAGIYQVTFTYVGYENKIVQVDLTTDRKLNMELGEAENKLTEAIVTAERQDKNITENKMSVVTIDLKTVKKLPLLLGEADIIKAIQLMPGVQSAGDGNTLTIVRGGNVDHNLVLLDEAVVYNPSHVIGFFSVFNGDAIKEFELYKGGIPAIYGGRLASVLDVKQKDGNSKRIGVSGGIGVLSSRLTIEGPIQKEKSSFLIAGRRSYFDLFFPLNKQTKDAIANFGDLNAKVNFQLGAKDRLYVSAYTGRDRLGFGGLAGFGWGNTTTTVRWNHLFNSKWFSNTSFIYSRYNYNIDFNIAKNLNFTRKNYIDDMSLKSDFTYYASPKSTVKFGFFNTFHVFLPGKIAPITSESMITGAELPQKRALSQAYYGSHQYTFTPRFNVEYGLRVSVFQNIGGREFVYANGQKNFFENGSVRPGTIMDTTFYNAGEVNHTYAGLEPRLNMTYKIDSRSAVKASYNRMFQYVHLIQNIAASTGQEFWTPSTSYIKPQRADQVAVGYFRNFFNDVVEASAEVYYKDMQNTLELIDNADINFNEAVESQLVAGKGRAYGLELLVKKTKGKTTGWIGYTLSKSERKADNINNNQWYAFRYDRRHYATFIVSHDYSSRVNFSANFILASGDMVTVPVGYYYLNGVSTPHYSNRNEYRIPTYHRLDVSMTLGRKKIEGKTYKNESNWVFSIYNVYGRKNYYTLDFRQNPDTGQNEAVKSYLFTFVPSVTYNFKF